MQSKLSRKDIVAAVGGRFFSRGKDYQERGLVLSVQIVEETPELLRIGSRVRGSGGRIYEQAIEIEWLADSALVSGTCSCPMDFDCKHVAAACLSYMTQPPVVDKPTGDDAGIIEWLTDVAAAGSTANLDEQGEMLAYVLKQSSSPGSRTIDVDLRVTHLRKNGQGLTKGRGVNLASIFDAYHTPTYLRPEDSHVLGLLRALLPSYWAPTPELQGRTGYLALEQMVATGRCFWVGTEGAPLRPGEPRPLEIAWREVSGKRLQLQLDPGPQSRLLTTEPPAYLDTERHLLGPLEAPGLSSAQLERLRDAPELPKERAEAISRTLLRRFPQLPLPPPTPLKIYEITEALPVPCLILAGQQAPIGILHILVLEFEYQGLRVPALPAVECSTVDTESVITRITRNRPAENRALETLTDLGFRPQSTPTSQSETQGFFSPGESRIESASRWSKFLRLGVPELRSRGWHVETDSSFLLRFETGDWEVEVEENDMRGNDWFGLRFDMEVDGRRLPLLPLIAPLLESSVGDAFPDILSVPLDPSGSTGSAYHFVDLPTARLVPFLDTLRDLFDSGSPITDGNLTLSRFDVVSLGDLEGTGIRIRGGDALRELARKLSQFEGIQPAVPPEGLQTELRSYQRQGLSWLQFLSEYDLGGMLADDMGLGKTIQTLAHLLLEKEAGRLDHPAFVVAPTSLIGNWRREAQHFAPGLRVLVLHGLARHSRFDAIADHDLVLTTYALLARDAAALAQHRFHTLILDEAQNIKNPRTKAASVVRGLSARHRLCLTGTPMENHLGELWSLFDFLLPGFLGNEKCFKRHWRTPIEQHADAEKQQRLARRIAPFMLRRRKQDVLTELPPKTEIIRTVALDETQAALYESIRLSMEKRVRNAIATQGMARSHITILDALLKLRQTCCDPRLLSLATAAKVQVSAKLELLLDMLPEQLEEGRRVLLFSQFTTMLELIETELEGRGIAYSKLTGRTRKRDEAIEQFRSGRADVFLISIKAGGVGLNLTEADTVILYDPWWNPAVETQAADRAHRIGQDKPVFVYKLVTENTVEEKILAMQARKQALADGVYRERGASAGAGFDAADLRELFAPISPD